MADLNTLTRPQLEDLVWRLGDAEVMKGEFVTDILVRAWEDCLFDGHYDEALLLSDEDLLAWLEQIKVVCEAETVFGASEDDYEAVEVALQA